MRASGARLWAILISSFQAQRNAASSGNHHRPPQPSGTVHLRSRGSPWVLGPTSKSGQESEDERELLVPGDDRTSIRMLSSTVEVAAHCLVKSREEGGRFVEEGHETSLKSLGYGVGEAVPQALHGEPKAGHTPLGGYTHL